jgi:TolA-binding protein
MNLSGNRWKLRIVAGIMTVLLTAVFAAAQENIYDKAVKAYDRRDFKTAVKYLKEYVEKKPDAYAYYLLGYALYKMKDDPASAKYFREAYTLDPNVSPSSGNESVRKKGR